MTEPELIHMDYSLFRADGQWHHIGHGIEVMATLDMWAGSFYIRAREPAPCETCTRQRETPCTREDGAGGKRHMPPSTDL